MATAAVETPIELKPVDNVPDTVENGVDEATNKRSSEEAGNESPSTTAKKQKPAPKVAASKASKGGKKSPIKKDATTNGKAKAVKEEAADADADDEEMPAPATPAAKRTTKPTKTPESLGRKRLTANGETASPRGIPRSWEEATPADRMLCKMKEDGKDWTEIREMWKELTGEDTGKSTLPNRYSRIKCNMTVLAAGHDRVLLKVKAAVEQVHEGKKKELEAKKVKLEQELEASKWAQIADGVKERTGTAYQTAFIQKSIKELEAAGGLDALSEGEDDSLDEEIVGGEDEIEVEVEENGDEGATE